MILFWYTGNPLLTSQLIAAVATTSAVWIARRFIDKRSFTSLGFKLGRMALKDFAIGTVISALLMGMVFVAEWALGWLHFEAFAWSKVSWQVVLSNIALYVIIFLIVAWNEELLARGYWFQNIEDGTNVFWALLLSSAFFAVGHAGNPNASYTAVLALVLAGIFLAFGYIRTRQLWLPIGLHFGWNLFEGTIFGFPVSGIDMFRVIQQTNDGPAAWTGGAFGPEAGLIIIPTLAIGVGLIFLYTRGRIRKNSNLSGETTPH